MRRGQTQVLTAVLLGGILIAGVGAAYAWGLPILQKNQDVSNAERSLNDMKALADAVSTVAQEGGSREVTVHLADGSMRIDPAADTITYRTVTRGAYVSTARWVPLNENDMQGVNRSTGRPADGYGIQGVDAPGVLVGTANRGTDTFTTTYRIVFRPLRDPTTGQTMQVDLVEGGNLQASGGTRTVVVSNQGTATEPGAGVEGGNLRRLKVSIRVS